LRLHRRTKGAHRFLAGNRRLASARSESLRRRIEDRALESAPPHEVAARPAPGPLRGRGADWRWRDGRGVSRPGREARSRGCDQDRLPVARQPHHGGRLHDVGDTFTPGRPRQWRPVQKRK
jgi:hypothetical protein